MFVVRPVSRIFFSEVPVGWTLSPALAALAPAMMEYTYSHASGNDSFVTGPSGVGYTNPDTFAYALASVGLS